MGKQERNVNIDIMKSIAAFGVCFAHFNNFMVYQLLPPYIDADNDIIDCRITD